MGDEEGMNMGKGGKRPGAGRPKGQGPYLETTKPIRVPESMMDAVRSFVQSKVAKIPLYGASVQAGFPSPADDHIEGTLDLNAYLVKHPAATFFVRATGHSMMDAGIHPGDVLVVDRSLEAVSGKIVIAALDGQLTVKRLNIQDGKTFLLPENKDFSPIEIKGEDVVIWGVVTCVLHQV